MSPSPGMRLGHYEIVETIGKGGMGEVYRARETAFHLRDDAGWRQADAVHGGAQLGRGASEVTD